MIRIAPSILSADFADLGNEVRRVAAAGADWIHVDVMDGHFVPNLTIGPPVVAAVRRVTDLPLDVHLMMTNPAEHLDAFLKAGADQITVHVEVCGHLNRCLQQIRAGGGRAGVALNPATPLETVRWVAALCDVVMVMSVNPGFGGQAFIPNSLERIAEMRRLLASAESRALIEVDGGVNPSTAESIIRAGADVLVAGSAVFNTPDYARAIAALREPAAARPTPSPEARP